MATSTGYANYLATTRAAVLADRISDLAYQLQLDVEDADRVRLYSEIRNLRRALNSLEFELCEEEHEEHGDAC